jgi:hypothetical protein
MRKQILLILLLTIVICTIGYGQKSDRPIVIITQDGEVDDRSSFVRFLLYTADIDLRGIIATNSKWQKNGHGLDWVYELYENYDQVYENLLLHRDDYPSSEDLKAITVLGNEDPAHLTGGAPYVDSEGSELILKELLTDEKAPLHINCWGGANTVAHSLWKLKSQYPNEFERAISRVRIYCVSFQDDAGDWIKEHIPEAMIIEALSFDMTWNYHNKEPLKHNPFPQVMSEAWLNKNIKQNHGPLGSYYPQKNISEGDTPAFLNFVDNGLKAYENYEYGGWGGRFYPAQGNYWRDAFDDNNDKKPLWRWCLATQNDFAARMDWCVNSYEEANHPPTIESISEPIAVEPGQKVDLSAKAVDPDGDELYYWWWHYPDPTSMEKAIRITFETSNQATFTVPNDLQEDIHIILEVSDDGTPSLKKYQRLVFKLK